VGHLQLAVQIVHAREAAEGVLIMVAWKKNMSRERKIGTLHFLVRDTVDVAVIGILQFFFIQKKTCEAVLLQLRDQLRRSALLNREGKNKLEQSGMQHRLSG
jgi:hypothetical protein